MTRTSEGSMSHLVYSQEQLPLCDATRIGGVGAIRTRNSFHCYRLAGGWFTIHPRLLNYWQRARESNSHPCGASVFKTGGGPSTRTRCIKLSKSFLVGEERVELSLPKEQVSRTCAAPKLRHSPMENVCGIEPHITALQAAL